MPAYPSHIALPVLAIGDVHGMADDLARALAEAEAHDAFPILLGDLVDKGPDSVAVLRIVVPRLAAGTLALVRGNHDERLLKSLTRPDGKKTKVLLDLLAAPDGAALAALTARMLAAAPYWISLPGYLLVHGAFHPEMLTFGSGGAGPGVPGKLRALALYGETDGTFTTEGFPVRTYRWVDHIPEGLTVVAGHDTRQMHEPLVVENASGGRAVFLDTGAAKGGRLSTWAIRA
ncbi:MAG: metallophosphoesterase [Hyphomicrobiaceae bacterium]